MADTIKHDGPGCDGTTQGQIKTPMASENVGNKGGEKTHSYKKAVGEIDKGSGKGNSIEGPGAKGNWSAGIKISGNNKKY